MHSSKRKDIICARLVSAEGPHSQVYAHSLTADNATMNVVDLGDMGGMLHSTSYVEGDSLVTQLKDQETDNHTITSTRTRTEGEAGVTLRVLKLHPRNLFSFSSGSNLMVHELLHVPSGSAVKFYYYKLG